mmetsp:Transcript_46250/g.142652  ORF Transcript_46250/g.142652 Transcript_46250/m.142652 type:complete len:238 (+) Transcript_46250:1304-2017(+)
MRDRVSLITIESRRVPEKQECGKQLFSEAHCRCLLQPHFRVCARVPAVPCSLFSVQLRRDGALHPAASRAEHHSKPRASFDGDAAASIWTPVPHGHPDNCSTGGQPLCRFVIETGTHRTAALRNDRLHASLLTWQSIPQCYMRPRVFFIDPLICVFDATRVPSSAFLSSRTGRRPSRSSPQRGRLRNDAECQLQHKPPNNILRRSLHGVNCASTTRSASGSPAGDLPTTPVRCAVVP